MRWNEKVLFRVELCQKYRLNRSCYRYKKLKRPHIFIYPLSGARVLQRFEFSKYYNALESGENLWSHLALLRGVDRDTGSAIVFCSKFNTAQLSFEPFSDIIDIFCSVQLYRKPSHFNALKYFKNENTREPLAPLQGRIEIRVRRSFL